MAKEEKLQQARMRVLAKKFKERIPNGMALHIPEDIIQQIPEGDEEMFFNACRGLNLERIEDKKYYWLFGMWQKL